MAHFSSWSDQLQRVVICIGAQKAATSFIFDQLVDEPKVLTTPRKEVHFWCTVAAQADPIWLHRSKQQYRRARQMLPLNLLRHGLKSISSLLEARKMVSVREGGPEAWHAYQQILLPRTQEQTVAFEATPSYALLPVETYRQMMNFHPNVHILYMLRDPVKRLWSAMDYSMRHEIAKGLKSKQDVSDAFQLVLNEKDGPFLHSNYPKTLNRLIQAGLGDRTHVMFMETMEENRELKALEHALGFKPTLNFKRVVNRNEHKSKPPPEQLEQAGRIMEPIYNEIRDRFGKRVPKSWLG